MASVTLDDAWLHKSTDNSVYITAVLTGLSEGAEVPGEIRRYANGRLRAVSRAGLSQNLAVSLDLADRADVDQIRTWVQDRELLMFRDPVGRKVWGRIFALSVTELAGVGSAYANAAFTFQRTTHSEAV